MPPTLEGPLQSLADGMHAPPQHKHCDILAGWPAQAAGMQCRWLSSAVQQNGFIFGAGDAA